MLETSCHSPCRRAATTIFLISELLCHLATMANMTFEDVDVEAVAELSAEEVEQMILGAHNIGSR